MFLTLRLACSLQEDRRRHPLHNQAGRRKSTCICVSMMAPLTVLDDLSGCQRGEARPTVQGAEKHSQWCHECCAAPQVRQEALQAKQSMFNRHSATEKALREHKDLLGTAREELAGQRSLVETLRANAKNLRQQLSACKVSACRLRHPCHGRLCPVGRENHDECMLLRSTWRSEPTTTSVTPMQAVAMTRGWHCELI